MIGKDFDNCLFLTFKFITKVKNSSIQKNNKSFPTVYTLHHLNKNSRYLVCTQSSYSNNFSGLQHLLFQPLSDKIISELRYLFKYGSMDGYVFSNYSNSFVKSNYVKIELC